MALAYDDLMLSQSFDPLRTSW